MAMRFKYINSFGDSRHHCNDRMEPLAMTIVAASCDRIEMTSAMSIILQLNLLDNDFSFIPIISKAQIYNK